MKIPKAIKVFAFIFFVSTWVLMCVIGTYSFIRGTQQSMDEFAFGPLDVVRRYTSPAGENTAILVRSYGSFAGDVNFILYLTDNAMVNVKDSTEKASFIADHQFACGRDCAVWISRAMWISPDYDPSTYRNWHEDLVWSTDGAIIAVLVEEQYVFAYDFGRRERHEEAQVISALLKLHSD